MGLLRSSWILSACCALVGLQSASAQDADALRARHAALAPLLINNPYQRPLHIESSASAVQLQGEIYTRLEKPYPKVAPALGNIDHWCDILILHLNVKHCERSQAGTPHTLTVLIGRKYDQRPQDAYRVQFVYTIVSTPDYVRVVLNAESGPLGTKDYRIVLQAAALDAHQTFFQLSYSYAYGVTARIATEGYLATLGRNKIGFTVIGRRADGQPLHVGGVRGMVERNAMRYYLAIEAYLDAAELPPSEQPERRLRDWYAATERHAAQLHELERTEYLEMKRREIARQKASSPRSVGS